MPCLSVLVSFGLEQAKVDDLIHRNRFIDVSVVKIPVRPLVLIKCLHGLQRCLPAILRKTIVVVIEYRLLEDIAQLLDGLCDHKLSSAKVIEQAGIGIAKPRIRTVDDVLIFEHIEHLLFCRDGRNREGPL